ncbi:MAG: GAF and ANTAR domain-containing protein [Candidatus Omnitrophica bacterium]|nr:GAF and ANTAR domain-containing protein [Candidatus Omnitrophota bacterium]
MAQTKDKIEALYKIGKAITSDLYLEDILKLIVTVTAQAMGSNVCSLMLIDEKQKVLAIRASQSISEGYNKKGPLRIGEGVAGKVVLSKKPRTVYNVLEDKDYKFKDIAGKDGLVSLLCVPMMVKNKAIGALNLYTSKPHKFTESEIEILTTVANQAALVIENTELMVKTKVIQEELESRKLIERAKGILMKQKGLSEEEAYKVMQRHSMDSRKSMRQIAEAVILSAEIK